MSLQMLVILVPVIFGMMGFALDLGQLYLIRGELNQAAIAMAVAAAAQLNGTASAYAMFNLQERGSLFVTPGTEVYEGMIVGENSRTDDMDVNITRERKVTNVRQSTGEELERLVPPRLLSLEQALEFCADDECVEVTAAAVRLRKTILNAKERGRDRGRASRAAS